MGCTKKENIEVSLCVSGSYDGHDYVDLGLPSGTLWATCNVGSSLPEERGDYFAWGETATKTTYYWSNYKYADGPYDKLTKYCSKASFGYNGFTDNLTILQACDDAATNNWGADWWTPTYNDWQELYQNTTSTWTTYNGVNGLLFTANNGKNLFLPAIGSCWEDKVVCVGNSGDYWSGTLDTDDPLDAYFFSFTSDFSGIYTGDYRYFGRSVRPVHSGGNNGGGGGSNTTDYAALVYNSAWGGVDLADKYEMFFTFDYDAMYDQHIEGFIEFQYGYRGGDFEYGLVDATGTYTISGNVLTAKYTYVGFSDWHYGSTYGFVDGQSKTVTYTIQSCTDEKMVVKESATGTIITLEKLY